MFTMSMFLIWMLPRLELTWSASVVHMHGKNLWIMFINFSKLATPHVMRSSHWIETWVLTPLNNLFGDVLQHVALNTLCDSSSSSQTWCENNGTESMLSSAYVNLQQIDSFTLSGAHLKLIVFDISVGHCVSDAMLFPQVSFESKICYKWFPKIKFKF